VVSEATRKLVEGYFQLKSIGPTRVKGVNESIQVYEVTGLGPLRTRLQRAASRGYTKFVGREREMDTMRHAAPAIFFVLVGEAHMETGRPDDGLDAVTQALATADAHADNHYRAEMHRLKAELLLRRNDSNEAEARRCFERAIEVARKQSAKSLELRATTSLARLLASQGRRDEARAMLAEIYNWFTEGFDTADLKDAKALVD
jgi:tetratricopeptide (TPR) repeat protein